MARTKVAVIGAGSFVFGPSVLSQAILEHKLDDLDLVLVDLDAEVATLMAAAGQRMADVTGVKAKITGTADRAAALDGAAYVINSAAIQIHKRFAADVEIIHRFDPAHLVTEFGGIAGISYSLRQIALIQQIVADMKRLCPDAWLLDVANPLPRVCQAAHEEGAKTVGFCSATLDTYETLWTLFTGEKEHYPWPKARAKWNLVMGGVNHFTWLVAMVDRQTRKDLLPELRERMTEQQGAGSRKQEGDGGALPGAANPSPLGHPVAERLFRETGTLVFPNDNHTKDFLPPTGAVGPRGVPAHGSLDERAARLQLLRDIAEGRGGWEPLVAHQSWERTIDLVAALSYGRDADFHALNLVNAGQLPQVQRGVFVETPVKATKDGLTPRVVNLPPAVVPLVARAAAVSDTITKAALRRSRKLLREAVELDPTIVDKTRGWTAVAACLEAHADVLPAYS